MQHMKPRLFCCEICLDKDRSGDMGGAFTWKELLAHKHGKRSYHEIDYDRRQMSC